MPLVVFFHRRRCIFYRLLRFVSLDDCPPVDTSRQLVHGQSAGKKGIHQALLFLGQVNLPQDPLGLLAYPLSRGGGSDQLLGPLRGLHAPQVLRCLRLGAFFLRKREPHIRHSVYFSQPAAVVSITVGTHVFHAGLMQAVDQRLVCGVRYDGCPHLIEAYRPLGFRLEDMDRHIIDVRQQVGHVLADVFGQVVGIFGEGLLHLRGSPAPCLSYLFQCFTDGIHPNKRVAFAGLVSPALVDSVD